VIFFIMNNKEKQLPTTRHTLPRKMKTLAKKPANANLARCRTWRRKASQAEAQKDFPETAWYA